MVLSGPLVPEVSCLCILGIFWFPRLVRNIFNHIVFFPVGDPNRGMKEPYASA